MSHGTQLDLFEPLHAIDEIKTAVKCCAELISEMQMLSQQHQLTLSKLYLSLKIDSDKHAERLLKMEKALNKAS
jgi:hypothetical protein